MHHDILVSQEPLSRSVGRWLIENGYEPANSTGEVRAVQEIGSESIGILLQDSSAESYLYPFGTLMSRRHKRAFLGTIWFKDTKRYWVFEVYGGRFLEQAERLAEKMSKAFGVTVTPYLIRETARSEDFHREHND